jgi:hypothetical protein
MIETYFSLKLFPSSVLSSPFGLMHIKLFYLKHSLQWSNIFQSGDFGLIYAEYLYFIQRNSDVAEELSPFDGYQ